MPSILHDGAELCRYDLIDHVFFVHWFEKPTAAAIDQVLARLPSLRAETGGRVHYCSYSGVGFREPITATERKMMNDKTMAMLEFVDTLHLVVPGASIKQTLIRSLFRAMILVARKNNVVFIQPTVADMLSKVRADLVLPPSEILKRALDRQLAGK